MCHPVTWDGCEHHIDAVKTKVPADQWCTCPRDNSPAPGLRSKLAGLFQR